MIPLRTSLVLLAILATTSSESTTVVKTKEEAPLVSKDTPKTEKVQAEDRQDIYVAPSDSYAPPAKPSVAGTYYYYYPVSATPVQPAQPQYAPPRQGNAGANPLGSYGLPIGIAIIIGIGIIIAAGVVIAIAASTTTTTTTTSGRSLLQSLNDNLEEVTHYVYEGIKVWSQINN